MADVRVNAEGRRIGESHPRAVLSDAEIEQLIADRAAGLSFSKLARKWKISKSGARGIVDGSRRGQVGPRINGKPSEMIRARTWLSLTLGERAKLRRLGGAKWVRRMLELER